MDWHGLVRLNLGRLLWGRRRPSRDRWRGPRYIRLGRRERDLLAVTQQLAAIVRANAPMAEGIGAAALDARRDRVEAVLLMLREDLEAGYALAEAMRRRPRFFPAYYVDLVRAGEQTGCLAASLASLSDAIEGSLELRSRLGLYLGYLLFVLAVQMTLGVFFFVKVSPVFTELVADYGGRSSALMETSLKVFDAVEPLEIFLVLAGVAVWVLAFPRVARRRGALRWSLSWVGLHLPFLRPLIMKSNLGRIALVLECLTGGGVPLDDALEDAAGLDVCPRFARFLRRVRERVRSGDTLTTAVQAEGRRLPKSFVTLVSMGESSGRLGEAFARIADIYGRDVAKYHRILMDTLTPLGVLSLGCVGLFFSLLLFSQIDEIHAAFLREML